MDIDGQFERTNQGHKYILTIVDEATRFPGKVLKQTLLQKKQADSGVSC